MPTTIRGIVGTPMTPFTSDNKVDGDKYQRLVDFLIRHGANALALPMHIGESINMTSEERKDVVRLAVEAAAGRAPVFAHTSLSGTDEVIELSRHAEKVGAQGLVVISPYHWRPPAAALMEHFRSIANSVGIGMIVYNFPDRAGLVITPEMLVELIETCPNIVGLKDASMGMEYFTEVCRLTSQVRPGFSVFTGIEYFLPSMVLGGVGAFSACGGVAPKLVKAVYDACLARDYERARPLQHQLSQLFTLIRSNYPAGIKSAMAYMGRDCGPVRKPLMGFKPDALKKFEAELDKLDVLANEPRGF
jgi:4-hydroxy-tetrahydrodipicolinate synthase